MSCNLNLFILCISLLTAGSKKIKEHVTNVQEYLKRTFQGIKFKSQFLHIVASLCISQYHMSIAKKLTKRNIFSS